MFHVSYCDDVLVIRVNPSCALFIMYMHSTLHRTKWAEMASVYSYVISAVALESAGKSRNHSKCSKTTFPFLAPSKMCKLI